MVRLYMLPQQQLVLKYLMQTTDRYYLLDVFSNRGHTTDSLNMKSSTMSSLSFDRELFLCTVVLYLSNPITDNFFAERCLNLSDLCMLHKNKTKKGIVRRFDKKCDIKLSTCRIPDF